MGRTAKLRSNTRMVQVRRVDPRGSKLSGKRRAAEGGVGMKVRVVQNGETSTYVCSDLRTGERSIQIIQKTKAKSELDPVERDRCIAVFYGSFRADIEWDE